MERSTTKARRKAKRARKRAAERGRHQLHCLLAALFLTVFCGFLLYGLVQLLLW